MQKILVTATVALAVGAAVFEWHRASEMQAEIRILREQHASSTSQIERLQHERDEAFKRMELQARENTELKSDSTKLSSLRDEVAQLKAGVQVDATQSAAKSWLERVNELKQRMEQTPDAKIPEIQLLTERNWLDAAMNKLETEEDYRRAMARLRNAGEDKFISVAQPALREYLRANGGQFPTDLSQLKPYFKPPVDDAILQRYEIVPSGNVRNLGMGGQWIITQKALVDEEYDSTVAFGPSGYGSSGPDPLFTVLKAFSTANGGKGPADYSQLWPYVMTPAQQKALQNRIQNLGTDTTFPGSTPDGN